MDRQMFPCSFRETEFPRQIAIDYMPIYIAVPVHLDSPRKEDFARDALQFSSKAVVLILN